MMTIPFNKPYITGYEEKYISEVLRSNKLSGDGDFTKACHQFFEREYAFKKVLLTTSCTDALEMASLLANIKEGDEVIMPSYTFVSTANAFMLRGAKIVFADSELRTPNMDVEKLEQLITPNTKAIVPVHYAGVACDMSKIMALSKKYNLLVIEDAAHAIDSYYKNQLLGSIGNIGAFSFHDTKNIIAGEGGMIAINDNRFLSRSEIVREKGTNRSQFFRGEVDKYGWVDIGSSFLPSEIIAAFLLAQLQNVSKIQKKRISVWNRYYKNISLLKQAHPEMLPYIPHYATNNAHMFYMKCNSLEERDSLLKYLSENGIKATFHYLSLHKSKLFESKHDGRQLAQADVWTDCLIRLPMFPELTEDNIDYISEKVIAFYRK